MEIAKMIVDLIGILIWPIVVLIIVLIFHRQIINLLPHIKTVKAAGVELTIDKIEEIVEQTIENKFDQTDAPENMQNMIYQDKETSKASIEVPTSDAGNSTMLAFATSQSYDENVEYGIYYDPATRKHNSAFKYIGLYKDGVISAVGKLNKIVYCNYEDGKLIGTNGDDLNRLSNEEYERIKRIIENTNYYELQEGCKFFLVDKFYKTNFEKASDYPLRAKKYIWLNEIDGFKEGMKSEKLADFLKGKEWE